MNPESIITQAMADGVTLALSATGSIKATGSRAAVNRWLAAIREHKAGIVEVLKAEAGDIAAASRAWLIHTIEGDPLQVVCVPDMTHASILAAYSDAVAVTPLIPSDKEPCNPMTTDEESAIRAWLDLIDETDRATIAIVLHECHRDVNARNYFLRRAETALSNSLFLTDDLREKEASP